MEKILSKLTLSIKDYQSDANEEISFAGEVVSIDDSLKTNLYRFYQDEQGWLMVSIDYSKDKIVIRETSNQVKLFLELKENEINKCTYQIDNNYFLKFNAKCFKVNIDENLIELDYELFAENDSMNPITRNTIKIETEVKKLC